MKIPEKIDKKLISRCGVECFACAAYVREKDPCPGCRERSKRTGKRDCAKIRCALEKGVEWCFLCEKYPCARIRNLNKRYIANYGIDLVSNGLEAKKDFGAYIENRIKAVNCPECGEVVDIHNRRCSGCKKDFSKK